MVLRHPHLRPSVFTLLESIFKLANTSMFMPKSGNCLVNQLQWISKKIAARLGWKWCRMTDPFLGTSTIWAFNLMYIKLMPWCIFLTETCVFSWFQDDSKTTCSWFSQHLYTSAKQKTHDTLEEFWQCYIHIVVLDANVTVTVAVNAINHWAFGHAWEKGF